MPSSVVAGANGFGPVKLSVESGLASPGDTVSCRDTLNVEAFEMGGRSFTLDDGLTYDVALTNTGDGILATGIVRAHAVTVCDRCLEPASFDIAAEVSCYYLHEEPQGEVADEEDFGLIDPLDGTIDLAEAIWGAVAMDVPYVVLCREDCKGLCPVCGANLNDGDCGCEIVPDPDFEQAENPFAALAGFTFADGTTLADHADELAEADGDAGDEDDLSDEEFEAEWERMSAAAAEPDEA